MVSVSRTFTVDKPVEEVVAYLADFANAEEWDPGTQSCRQTSSGPVAVGTTWRNVSKVAGLTTELDYELVELAPGRIVFVGRNKTATSTDTVTVRRAVGGSEVTYDAVIELKGLAKIGGPVMQLLFERIGNETQESITRALSSRGPSSRPVA